MQRLRVAFTLIELLVVIAIIGVLVSLLLPAVQKVRAAAARSASSNNLHQIVLATFHYQDQYQYLPDRMVPINNVQSNGPFSSVFTKILPYVEQEALYLDVLSPGASLTKLEATIKTFISPADATAPDTRGGTSYADNDTVFGTKGRTLARSFPDGCGTTILFTERYMYCGPPPFPAFNAWSKVLSGGPIGNYLSTVAPNLALDAPLQFNPGILNCQPGGASSFESTVILVAMADGSVRAVSAGATGSPSSKSGVSTWQAALTPDGGETLSPDW
jgi:prepilin-type N-terminal cleavage/methylation domain-containing protein